ncbi:Protein STB2 [Fusarium oxysporum f. sp. albedinis]|jgi:hypothetical protein|nr:Protein STB2 [Fusarium oxysporum f. sp. albedinis]KAK2469841.1 hypothetical protein H9L39_18656 [Fusarium oxysporum f. sp. albedinis]
MPLPSIQDQWKIDETLGRLVFDEALRETAHDNVHALVRVACEQFSNTLAICENTLSKVETAIVATPQPATVLFLNATVGYLPNDSAAKLMGSMAGRRFLGLAAALTTLFNLFDGAKTLNTMLISSASDPFPSMVRQLQDLLASLQGRLYRAGFSESVIEWQVKLQRDAIADEGHSSGSLSFFFNSLPPPEMVVKLVDVFRRFSKGGSTIMGVIVKAGATSAWVAAFTEWCLGNPPSICIEGSQQPLSQLDSVITLIIPNTPDGLRKELEITVHDSLDHRDQLIASPSTKQFSGMTTIGNYGKWMLERFGFRGTSLKALHEALDYAIPQTLEKLKWAGFDLSGQEAHRSLLHQRTDDFVDGYTLYPLPDIRKIASVYSKLLSPENTPQFSSLGDHELIADLHEILKSYMLMFSMRWGITISSRSGKKRLQTG